MLENDKPGGLLRYNLFWDNTPFCTILFIDWNNQKKGYEKELLEYWEKDMKSQGYNFVLISTQVDEVVFDSGRFSWNLFLNCDTGFAFYFERELYFFLTRKTVFSKKKQP